MRTGATSKESPKSELRPACEVERNMFKESPIKSLPSDGTRLSIGRTAKLDREIL